MPRQQHSGHGNGLSNFLPLLTCTFLQCCLRASREGNGRLSSHKRQTDGPKGSDGPSTNQFPSALACADETCASHAEHPSIIMSCSPSPPCSLRQVRHGNGDEKMVLTAPSRTWLVQCALKLGPRQKYKPQNGQHDFISRAAGSGSILRFGAL